MSRSTRIVPLQKLLNLKTFHTIPDSETESCKYVLDRASINTENTSSGTFSKFRCNFCSDDSVQTMLGLFQKPIRHSAKLGKTIIKGDIHDMSNNGQKLHNMIIKYNLHVINSMEICTGIFTRANNKIIGEKSVLDYVIASDDLLRYIKKRRLTPISNLRLGVA